MLSIQLLLGLLFALEFMAPAEVPFHADLFSGGEFDSTLEVRRLETAYQFIEVNPDGRRELFVAEPSDRYAHVYTVFPSEAQVEGADSGPRVFDMAPFFPDRTPSAGNGADGGETSVSVDSDGEGTSGSEAWRRLERERLIYFSNASAGIVLVVRPGVERFEQWDFFSYDRGL